MAKGSVSTKLISSGAGPRDVRYMGRLFLFAGRMDRMSIRKMKEIDFEGIRKLVLQVHKLHVENRPDIYNDIDPFDQAYFDFLMGDGRTITLVCETDEKIVGFCAVTLREPSRNPLMKARTIAYMEDLCVDASYRKKGIGKLLFEESKKRAKDRGFDVMELMVWSFNSNAVQFYENLGMSYRGFIMEQKFD